MSRGHVLTGHFVFLMERPMAWDLHFFIEKGLVALSASRMNSHRTRSSRKGV